MNRRQFLGASALLLAGALSACGSGPNQDLAQQFLTERNGGTPVAIGVGGPNAPVLGSIQSVDGTRLMVKPPLQDNLATVQLADDVKIRKDVDVQIGEITAGASVTAFGTRQGDRFQADLLRLGGADAEPIVFSSASGSAGEPPAGGQNQIIGGAPIGEKSQPISGVVESIAGRTIVLKDQAGASSTVELAGDGKIQKSTEANVRDLIAGTFIMASGSREGDIFRATQIQILPQQQH